MNSNVIKHGLELSDLSVNMLYSIITHKSQVIDCSTRSATSHWCKNESKNVQCVNRLYWKWPKFKCVLLAYKKLFNLFIDSKTYCVSAFMPKKIINCVVSVFCKFYTETIFKETILLSTVKFYLVLCWIAVWQIRLVFRGTKKDTEIL